MATKKQQYQEINEWLKLHPLKGAKYAAKIRQAVLQCIVENELSWEAEFAPYADKLTSAWWIEAERKRIFPDKHNSYQV